MKQHGAMHFVATDRIHRCHLDYMLHPYTSNAFHISHADVTVIFGYKR